MSSYVNCGATIAGRRVPTKKALKLALADPATAHRVEFDSTSMFDGGGTYRADTLTEGITLSVVGPDPYNDRRWYASVTRRGGKVTVS